MASPLNYGSPYRLHKPVEYLRLRKRLALLLGDADLAEHVAALAVHHHDAQVALLIDEVVLVGDDVWVAELLQQFQLILDVFLVAVGAVRQPQLLYDVVRLLFLLVPAQEHLPKRPKLQLGYPTPIDRPI